ncbi:MAG: 1-deoxy-D-xylulose-5-phosphate synthase [Elusimicrobia bacterium]|nr:1-deoxy-D-xylulose-5-phosphate synthase [Candidatus Liberimonas magnetica]
MSILEKIAKPRDLHYIKKELLGELAKEIRAEMIKDVAANGGHLAPSLGTVELAIAIHYVFNAPEDKIIWDVGHQAYAHKMLTGRNKSFSTLRQHGGISGFPKREESEYDPFGVGHSSTSISAALGFAVARDMQGKDNKVVAVIGDGSMTGGIAFEALLNTGHIGTDLLVILNDNEMFISHRVGALAGYLAKLLTAGTLKKLEKRVEEFFKRIHFWGAQILRVAKRFKVLLFPGMLFEEMGFSYLGPVDGHDIFRLIAILENIKKLKNPVLLHVITKKGKGYTPAENDPTLFHGIGKFDVATGKPESSGTILSYTSVFGKTMIKLAKSDKRIVAITAAMQDGTGLDEFRKEFPDRFFDVGIAEEHAVTFAAGLACEGIKPVFAIYSTFLQRSLDQLIHDVALQKLNVIFAIDRAGIVGEDGPTHHGAFDLSYLNLIPNFTIMAPSNENELQHMLKTALFTNGPVAIRYPRGAALGITLDEELKELPIGKAQTVKEGKDLYILAIGNMVHPSLEAAKTLDSQNISAGVIDMRFLKPVDSQLILSLAKNIKHFVTVEENSKIGGLGSTVNDILTGKNCDILNIALPDQFIEHGNPKLLRNIYNLSEEKISNKIKDWLKSR